jgi:hypothetical protein
VAIVVGPTGNRKVMTQMRPPIRLAMRVLLPLAGALGLGLGVATSAVVSSPLAVSAEAVVLATANSHWTSCNDTAAQDTPSIVWTRIHQATDQAGLPSDFWTLYRLDIAKIICYESSYNWHAENVGQYGWYQMNKSLISSEGVSFSEYWYGTKYHAAGWYQCVAGERYIRSRYGTPAGAWSHERYYGWY